MQNYPHQDKGLAIGLPILLGEDPLNRNRRMLVSPTGTGKGRLAGLLANGARAAGLNCGVLAPSPMIAEQLVEKGCPAEHTWSSAVKFRNRLLKGEVPPYDAWVVDEGHHAIAETVDMVLATAGRAIALTATGFRGTPRGTAALHQKWGKPEILLTMKEATEQGFMAMPEWYPCPVVDDDVIDTANGEFTSESSTQVVGSALPNVLDDLRETWDGRPGALILPSTILARRAFEELKKDGPTEPVLMLGTHPGGQKAMMAERMEIAERIGAGEPLLVIAVNVLGEGVDIPNLKDMWDASPTRSPVVAMQRWGRLTRPTGETPHIRVYSRNVERFAYLYDGLLPSSVVAEAQEAFGGPSKKGVSRGTLDIEHVSRFKALPVPLADGSWAEGHMLWAKDRTGEGGVEGEWALLWLPWQEKPITAFRKHDRAKWKRVDPPESLEGYTTSGRRWKMSDKQRDWWRKDGYKVGLNPDAEPDARVFAFLPALLLSRQPIRFPEGSEVEN